MKLPTMADIAAERSGKPLHKGLPRMIAKRRAKQAKADRGKQFRDEVWARDQGRSRATGKPLLRTGTTDWQRLGEVDHSIPRSLAPERVYETSNGLLLSKEENRLRKVPCVLAPEFRYFDYGGPENRGLPQTFIWRNDEGRITKTRIG